jgi:hypothetical protein
MNGVYQMSNQLLLSLSPEIKHRASGITWKCLKVDYVYGKNSTAAVAGMVLN